MQLASVHVLTAICCIYANVEKTEHNIFFNFVLILFLVIVFIAAAAIRTLYINAFVSFITRHLHVLLPPP